MKRRQPPQFPAATVAYYGPDDRTTTKIVVGIVQAEGQPVGPLKRWVGPSVRTDPHVRAEIADFIRAHGAKAVAMCEHNMGCVHEEGQDFPVGDDCPFCPFWKGKQGSSGSPRALSGVVMTSKEFFAR